MKIREFLYNDFSMKNNLKLRKIKLSMCGALLTLSFVIISYKTISLANVNEINSKHISIEKNQSSSLAKPNRGSIYNNKSK